MRIRKFYKISRNIVRFRFFLRIAKRSIDTGSEIPQGTPASTTLLTDFVISEEKITNVIRSLKPYKAHGWDEISVRMIKLSDGALVLPLKIIFTKCLRRGSFPEIWKCANVVPVHKKNDKNVKGNYRPISLLPSEPTDLSSSSANSQEEQEVEKLRIQ